MGIFNKKKNVGGLMDVIRCDEPTYLIWKWHPAGVKEGESRRENAIRWGSTLRVKDGEVAVFLYKEDDGVFQEYVTGPYDGMIKTANLPGLSKIIGLAYGGDTPFQAEIYFINLAKIVQVRFGVPFFDVFDPRFSDFGVPVSVRGTISFHITDYDHFISLHRMNSFSLEDFQTQIRDAVSNIVKATVTNAPSENDIPVVQIESKISIVNDSIESKVAERLREDFGVEVSGFDIATIEIDKTSAAYAQLMAVTRDVDYATAQAQKEAKVKNIHDMQRIEAENYEETLRIQREESQYATHKQSQTANFAAYQVEAQAQVGTAGAEALGKMNENGAGTVNLDGGGSGFNPAAMMASMAMGGTVGKNIAEVMGGVMSGTNPGVSTPPPIPTVAYNVAVDGKATGPFEIETLKQMAVRGEFTGDSLVWKAGMSEWVKASSISELASIFTSGLVMPPIPTDSE